MAEKKINMNITEGDAFFAHEMSINFNPTQFVFDFKSVTPRIDARSSEQVNVSLRHNVVLIDPYHAKRINELLTQMLERYETEFGKIKKPEAVKRYEEKRKQQTEEESKTEAPYYFG